MTDVSQQAALEPAFGDRAAQPVHKLVLASSVDDAPGAQPGTIVVVLDTTWSPAVGDRGDLLPLRPIVAGVIGRTNLVGEALERLDAWAAAADMPRRLTVDDIVLWYGLREELLHWLHERLLWFEVTSALRARFRPSEILAIGSEPALDDVLRLIAGDGLNVETAPMDGRTPTIYPPGGGRRDPGRSIRITRLGASLSRWSRRRGVARRTAALDNRVDILASGHADRVLVVSYTRVHQHIHGRSADLLVDPNLGSVIERMRVDGPDPIVIGLGLDHRIEASSQAISADDRLLPSSLLMTRWRGDERVDAKAVEAMEQELPGAAGVPLYLDGHDLAPALMVELRALAAQRLTKVLLQVPRIGRMLADLRPAAVLLTHEGIRAAWLVAARRAGIPIFAVQHGVLYPTHPGYCHPRDAKLILPDRTFVFGDYELQVLRSSGGYRGEEVEVSGSPRIDLDVLTERTSDPTLERAAVRHELGIRDGDRMLVVSTAHVTLLRRFYLVPMLESTLGGPLPGIHIVIKQHPGESDEGPYRALLHGLARAGSYEPPPITVVRDVDLYRLLRAADSHLGFHSTVLTDAVVVGVPNLIARAQPNGDLLGYVDAGVARPVRTVDDIRDALAAPQIPEESARHAFLDAHFRHGDASARIVEAIRRTVDTLEDRPRHPG